MENINGDPWTNERFFSNFEEADYLRKALKLADLSGTMQVKVKRCGENGTTYVVKSRIDKKIAQELKQIEEKMLTSKNKKQKNRG